MSSLNGHVKHVEQLLRLLQPQLADRPAEERRAILAKQLGAHVREMVSDDRSQLFKELLDRFPTWGEVIVEKPANPDDAPPGAWNDPAKLVARLAQLAGRSEEQRRRVMDTLKSHNLGGAIPPQLTKDLRAALGFNDKMQLVPTRIIELLHALIEAVGWSDNVLREIWQRFGRQSELLGSRRLVEIIARYAAMDDRDPAKATTQAELEDALLKLRRRLGLLNALYRNFAEDFSERFAPEQIERGISGWGKRGKLWNRYIAQCEGKEKVRLQTVILEQLKVSLDRATKAVGT